MKYTSCLIICVLILDFIRNDEGFSHFNPNRKPLLMGDNLPFQTISPQRKRVQNKIVAYHNFFRGKVQPVASNMLKMKWHHTTANGAQKWADECQFLIHDSAHGRHVPNYGSCGQNIFIASKKVPWFFAIETWWLEKNAFKYGKKNNMSIVGHYTQLVWATSHEVGCGLSKCYQKVYYKDGELAKNKTKVFYNYVCNYCPIGNRPGRTSRPYKLGNPCSSCKTNCRNKLCMNFCPYSDHWANCRQLYEANSIWLCHSHTPKGLQRARSCKATCTCQNKIYD